MPGPDSAELVRSRVNALAGTADTPPASVRLAVTFLWCGLALGVATIVITDILLRYDQHPAKWIPAFVALFVIAGVYVAIVIGIAQGRNWVRILMLLLVFFGAVDAVVRPAVWRSLPTWRAAEYFLQLLIDGIAVYFIFSRDANPWFRRRGTAKKNADLY
jgi:hypothetical protein